MNRIERMESWTPEYLAKHPNTACEDAAWAAARIRQLEADLAQANGICGSLVKMMSNAIKDVENV